MQEEEFMSVDPTNYDGMDLTPELVGRGEPDLNLLSTRGRRSLGRSARSIIAGAVLASIVVGVITNLADIKRYIRISTM